MKLSKSKLRRIIKEEFENVLQEEEYSIPQKLKGGWERSPDGLKALSPKKADIQNIIEITIQELQGTKAYQKFKDIAKSAAVGIGVGSGGVVALAAAKGTLISGLTHFVRMAALGTASTTGSVLSAALWPILGTYVGSKYVFPAVADYFLENYGNADAARSMGGPGWEAARKDPGKIQHVPVNESKLKQLAKEELLNVLNEKNIFEWFAKKQPERRVPSIKADDPEFIKRKKQILNMLIEIEVFLLDIDCRRGARADEAGGMNPAKTQPPWKKLLRMIRWKVDNECLPVGDSTPKK